MIEQRMILTDSSRIALSIRVAFYHLDGWNPEHNWWYFYPESFTYSITLVK